MASNVFELRFERVAFQLIDISMEAVVVVVLLFYSIFDHRMYRSRNDNSRAWYLLHVAMDDIGIDWKLIYWTRYKRLIRTNEMDRNITEELIFNLYWQIILWFGLLKANESLQWGIFYLLKTRIMIEKGVETKGLFVEGENQIQRCDQNEYPFNFSRRIFPPQTDLRERTWRDTD